MPVIRYYKVVEVREVYVSANDELSAAQFGSQMLNDKDTVATPATSVTKSARVVSLHVEEVPR